MGRTAKETQEEVSGAVVEATNGTADETVTVIKAEEKSNNPNRKVKIFLSKQRGLNAKDKQHININGKDFNIPLGEEVEIPYFVYDALMAIEADKDHEYDFIMANARIKEAR